MSIVSKCALLLIPILLGYLYYQITRTDPVPLVEDEYWGPTSEKGKKEDTSIRPFKIDISDQILEHLKTRLNLELKSNRLAPPLEGVGFQYGFNSKYLGKVIGPYWRDSYQWREREKKMNLWPQFKTRIGGLDIHYYHIKPKDNKSGKQTMPLLLLHGWPGSFVEFFNLIPYLSEPKNSQYSFELIIPSLPGFGFSSAAVRPGLGTAEIANLLKRLMDRIGHKKFFIVGRDAGSFIAAELAILYPERIIAVHSSTCAENSLQSHFRRLIAHSFPSIFLKPEEQAACSKLFDGWSDLMGFMIRESGYMHIQATKPDTVGIGLTLSPLGLAAYILEKFATWTNRHFITREDGGLTQTLKLDELLDNVMVYWVTRSITSSMRLYKEGLVPNRNVNTDRVPTNVPFACQLLPNDLLMGVFPEFVAKAKYTNLQRYTIGAKGGHFGGMEVPDIVAEDVIAFFNTL